MSSETFDTGGLGTDTRRLILRFVGILIVSPLVGWMLARAWVPGNSIYTAVAVTLADVIGATPARSLQMVGSAGLGLYFGFLFFFLIDMKKRVQGGLLLLGTALGLVVMAVQGVLLPNIELGYLPNYVAFVVFLLGALVVDGDKLTQYDGLASVRDPLTHLDRDPPEFDTATKALFGVVAVVVLASLVQVVIAGVWKISDFIAVPVTLALLWGFVQYEVKTDYMMIGPGQSGKSMTMLGMALALHEYADVEPKPSGHLQDAIEFASPGVGDRDWPFPQTMAVHETSFQMLVGDLFPKRMRLVAYDYRGQWLPSISDRVQEMASSSPLDKLPMVDLDLNDYGPDLNVGEVAADGGELADDEREDMVSYVAGEVLSADILMIVIDCERLVHPEEFDAEAAADGGSISLGIRHYEPILQNADVDEVILTATKADVMVHDESLPVEAPAEVGYETFKRQVDDLLDQRVDVRELKQELGTQELHPVFFRTYREDGEYVPVRTEMGNMVPVGYAELIEEVRNAA